MLGGLPNDFQHLFQCLAAKKVPQKGDFHSLNNDTTTTTTQCAI